MGEALEQGREYLLPVRYDGPGKYGKTFITLQLPGLTTEDDMGADIEDYVSLRSSATLIRRSRIDDLEWEVRQLRKALSEVVYFTTFHDRGDWLDDEKEIRDAIRNAAKALNIPPDHYGDWVKP
jgi:hypothetical protein